MRRHLICLLAIALVIGAASALDENSIFIKYANGSIEASVVQDNIYYSDVFFSGFRIKNDAYQVKFFDVEGGLILDRPYYPYENNHYNYSSEVARISIGRGESVLASKEVLFCNFNGICEPCLGADCELIESFFTCTDCPSGGYDLACDLNRDNICDPDCEDLDGDCKFCTLKGCFYDDLMPELTRCSEDFNGTRCGAGDGCTGEYVYADDTGSHCCSRGECISAEELRYAEIEAEKALHKRSLPPKILEEEETNDSSAIIYVAAFIILLVSMVALLFILKSKGVIKITMGLLVIAAGSYLAISAMQGHPTGFAVDEGGSGDETFYCEGADWSLLDTTAIASCAEPYVDDEGQEHDKIELIKQYLSSNSMAFYDPLLVAAQFHFESGCSHPASNGQGIGQVVSCAEGGVSVCTIQENINLAVQHIKNGLQEVKNQGIVDVFKQFVLNQFIYNRGRGTFLGFDIGGLHVKGTVEFIDEGVDYTDAMVQSCYEAYDAGAYDNAEGVPCSGLSRDACCVTPGGAGYYNTVWEKYEAACSAMGGEINNVDTSDLPSLLGLDEDLPDGFDFEDVIGYYYVNPAVKVKLGFDPEIYDSASQNAQDLVSACEGEEDLSACIINHYRSNSLAAEGWHISGCRFNTDEPFVPPEDLESRIVRFCISSGSSVQLFSGDGFVEKPIDILFALYFAPPDPVCEASLGDTCSASACCGEDNPVCCAAFALDPEQAPSPACKIEGFHTYDADVAGYPDKVYCSADIKPGYSSADLEEGWVAAFVSEDGSTYACSFDSIDINQYIFNCPIDTDAENVVCLGSGDCDGVGMAGAPSLVQGICRTDYTECAADGTDIFHVSDGHSICPFNVNLMEDSFWREQFCRCGSEVFMSAYEPLPPGAPDGGDLFCCQGSWSGGPCADPLLADFYGPDYLGTYPECSCGNGEGDQWSGSIYAHAGSPCDGRPFFVPWEGGKCCRLDGTAEMDPGGCPGGREFEEEVEPTLGYDWDTDEETCDTVGEGSCRIESGAEYHDICALDEYNNLFVHYRICDNGCSDSGGAHCRTTSTEFDRPDYSCDDGKAAAIGMLQYLTDGHATDDDAYVMNYLQQTGYDPGYSECDPPGVGGTLNAAICDEHLHELCGDGTLQPQLCGSVPGSDFGVGWINIACMNGCGTEEDGSGKACLIE